MGGRTNQGSVHRFDCCRIRCKKLVLYHCCIHSIDSSDPYLRSSCLLLPRTNLGQVLARKHQAPSVNPASTTHAPADLLQKGTMPATVSLLYGDSFCSGLTRALLSQSQLCKCLPVSTRTLNQVRIPTQSIESMPLGTASRLWHPSSFRELAPTLSLADRISGVSATQMTLCRSTYTQSH